MSGPEQEARDDCLRMAIAVITAWEEMEAGGSNTALLAEVIASYVDDGASATDVIAGLIALSDVLLERIEQLSGVSVGATVRDLGRRAAPPS